jgi:hypothetical protein
LTPSLLGHLTVRAFSSGPNVAALDVFVMNADEPHPDENPLDQWRSYSTEVELLSFCPEREFGERET